MLKPEAVHIQAYMNPYRQKQAKKISCGSPFKSECKRSISLFEPSAGGVSAILSCKVLGAQAA